MSEIAQYTAGFILFLLLFAGLHRYIVRKWLGLSLFVMGMAMCTWWFKEVQGFDPGALATSTVIIGLALFSTRSAFSGPV